MLQEIVKITIALILLALIFWVIEFFWAADRSQPRWRPDSKTDLFYWFFNGLVTDIVTKIAVVIAVVITAYQFPRLNPTIVGSQPEWLQLLEILVLGDILGYWIHRFFHQHPMFWPFHAVHHSPTRLDWLAAGRVHPLNSVLDKVLLALPFYYLGFQANVLAAYLPFLGFYALFVHANLDWDFGPLRWVITSPAFHRWHHASDKEALDKNFSGLFPFVDLIFGTAYFPRHRRPQNYGLYREQFPTSIWGQFTYPFRRPASPANVPVEKTSPSARY